MHVDQCMIGVSGVEKYTVETAQIQHGVENVKAS